MNKNGVEMHLHYYYLINLLSIIEKNDCRKGTVNIHTSLHLINFYIKGTAGQLLGDQISMSHD